MPRQPQVQLVVTGRGHLIALRRDPWGLLRAAPRCAVMVPAKKSTLSMRRCDAAQKFSAFLLESLNSRRDPCFAQPRHCRSQRARRKPRVDIIGGVRCSNPACPVIFATIDGLMAESFHHTCTTCLGSVGSRLYHNSGMLRFTRKQIHVVELRPKSGLQ